MTSEDLTPQRQRLAGSLKQLRLDAQLSAQELGVKHGWSQSKVSKIENGRTVPSVDDVRAWLRGCGVDDGDTIAGLVDLAAEVGTQARAWRQVTRGGHGVEQRQRADRDAGTSSIAIYQSEVVPGLLQTPDYARRLLEVHSLVPTDAIASTVIARLDRQAILFDESKQIDIVVTESALRWRPGSNALTLAQLDRIASLMTLPNISIGVVSLEAQERAKPLHSFVILRYGETAEVQVETLTAEVEVTAPEDVEIYEQFFTHQREHAIYGDQARELLDRIAVELRASPRAV